MNQIIADKRDKKIFKNKDWQVEYRSNLDEVVITWKGYEHLSLARKHLLDTLNSLVVEDEEEWQSEHKCTCYDGSWKCDKPALYRYKALPNGDWYYLCFDHWGMTCIIRIEEPDNILATSCERLTKELEKGE